MAGELILIVEDNERNLKLLRDVLQFNRYQTAEAATAEEALQIAQAQQPTLILMDIQLPGMDGITAFRHLKANPSTERIPVIAVTASAMTHDRQQILAAGFDGYLTKPISVGELTQVVRQIVDERSGSGGQGRGRAFPEEAS